MVTRAERKRRSEAESMEHEDTVVPMLNKSDAATFLELLDPDAKAFDFRAIYPKQRDEKAKRFSNKMPEDLRGSWADVGGRLQTLTNEMYGVFVLVNETDGEGTGKENVTRIRAVFADWDAKRSGGKSPIPRRLPLQPSFITETSPGSFQGYWLLADADDDDEMTAEQFDDVIAAIIAEYGGDPGCSGTQRILRVPGSWHTKTDELFQVRFHKAPEKADDVAVYAVDQIMKKFGPAIAKVQAEREAAAKRVTEKRAAKSGKSSASEFRADEVREALSCLDPDEARGNDGGYQSWLKIIWAISNGSDHSDEGFEVAKEWSKRSRDYDEAELELKFYDAKQRGEVELGSLFHHAMEAGYAHPKTTAVMKLGDVDDLSPEQIVALRKLNSKGRSTKAEPTEPKEIVGEVLYPATMRSSARNCTIADPNSLENVAQFHRINELVPWFNEFDRHIYVSSPNGVTKIEDTELKRLRMDMYASDCRVSADFYLSALERAAHRNCRHPVREYLSSLVWDEETRLEFWLHDYLGAEDSDFNAAVGEKWMVAAVRRVLYPGCKFDHMLVLEGAQGVGKSTAFRILAGEEWFGDATDVGASMKEVIETTQGTWIVECAELSGMTGKDKGVVKTFVSAHKDKARAAYGRLPETVPRQFVLAGTVNEDTYLKDDTGNRRFWPVKVGATKFEALMTARDQLWAEAYQLALKEDYKLYLDKAENKLAEAAQEKRREKDGTERQLEELFSNLDAWPDCYVTKSDIYVSLGYRDPKDRKGFVEGVVNRVMKRLKWGSHKVKIDNMSVWVFFNSEDGSWSRHLARVKWRTDERGNKGSFSTS